MMVEGITKHITFNSDHPDTAPGFEEKYFLDGEPFQPDPQVTWITDFQGYRLYRVGRLHELRITEVGENFRVGFKLTAENPTVTERCYRFEDHPMAILRPVHYLWHLYDATDLWPEPGSMGPEKEVDSLFARLCLRDTEAIQRINKLQVSVWGDA